MSNSDTNNFRPRSIEKEFYSFKNTQNRDAVSRYIDYLDSSGVTESTKITNIITLRKLSELLGDKFLNPSRKDIEDLLDSLKKNGYEKANGKRTKYSIPTMNMFIITMRAFYKHLLGDDERYPDCVSKLKVIRKRVAERPKQTLEREEVDAMIRNANNLRDKTLISLLYDSGCRIAELANLRITDLKFQDFGVVLKVFGKTGARQVIVTGNAVALLQQWVRDHPKREDKNSYVFCKIIGQDIGKQLRYNDIHRMIQTTAIRAKLEKKVTPHSFRHTYASKLAGKVTESVLEQQLGWVHGSAMSKVYVHISLRDQQNAILKANGIRTEENEMINEPRPVKCPRCGSLNTSDATYCSNCWMALTPEAALKMKETQEQAESALLSSSVVDENSKRYLKAIDKDYEDKLMDVILNDIASDPQKKEKYIRELMVRLSTISEKT